MARGIQIILLVLASSLVFWGILERGKSVQSSEVAYQKIFGGQHESMILGTSRAAMLDAVAMSSVNPSAAPFFNYAFHLGASPYGPKYTQSILNHIKKGDDNVFVLCVDPWALSSKKGTQDDSTFFQENGTFIDFDPTQALPEYRYFLNHYSNPYYSLFLPIKVKKHLEDNEGKKPSEAFIKKHQNAKIEYYKKEHLYADTLSATRLQSLNNLITTLNGQGKVYLVRLPISEEMIALEEEYAPNFKEMMVELSENHGVGFIDFYPIADQFLCPDGNHLFGPDAVRVSKMIGEFIKSDQSQGHSDTIRHLFQTNSN